MSCARVIAILLLPAAALSAAKLPDRYFELMSAGIAPVRERLAAEPDSTLAKLEANRGWRHFPSAILVAAVLYAKQHPANPRYRDPAMLETALAIGDLLAREQEEKRFGAALDRHRDAYMWLEACRLLDARLGEERRARWRRAIAEYLTPLVAEIVRRRDYPRYISPYIGTSPNHYSLWSSTIHLAGRVFGDKSWEELGAAVMHRFAAGEQSSDGFWGEQNPAHPTPGYDYLTATGVALYWEHSRDPAALEALRRNTAFHMHYTWPDGAPVEVLNDRNRYWTETMWGQFGFSNLPAGRRYNEFLMDFYPSRPWLEMLGRLAQNALYYHEGPLEPIPQDAENYSHRMSVPAGIRKTGSWVVALSGLADLPAPTQWRLDRQGHLSVFHRKTGLIITGANSKRQPELATFWEKAGGQLHVIPIDTRLQTEDAGDRLSLAYNSFFSVLEIPPPSEREARFRFDITLKGRGAEASLNLQLCLQPGKPLETGAGKTFTLDETALELAPEDIGGWIRHNGWTLHTASGARLAWPVRPYSPYSNGPEQGIRNAVGALSTPVGRASETLEFRIQVE